MSHALKNNLLINISRDKICTALGIKLVPTPEIVSIAKNAGYDSLFIELEHSNFSLAQASQLCGFGMMAGITPFVRVPHQCGNGFVQRVLDGGAMGVIFPHISTASEAQSAVQVCKFPQTPLKTNGVVDRDSKASKNQLQGKRSLSASLPHFGFKPTPVSTIMSELNAAGSTVFLMIETAQAISNIDDIAAVPGVDVLLIGSNDLSLELGVQGQWDGLIFKEAVEKVANACKTAGKVLGIAGLYNRPDLCRLFVEKLGARYVLGNLDIGLIAAAAKSNAAALRLLEE